MKTPTQYQAIYRANLKDRKMKRIEFVVPIELVKQIKAYVEALTLGAKK